MQIPYVKENIVSCWISDSEPSLFDFTEQYFLVLIFYAPCSKRLVDLPIDNGEIMPGTIILRDTAESIIEMKGNFFNFFFLFIKYARLSIGPFSFFDILRWSLLKFK